MWTIFDDLNTNSTIEYGTYRIFAILTYPEFLPCVADETPIFVANGQVLLPDFPAARDFTRVLSKRKKNIRYILPQTCIFSETLYGGKSSGLLTFDAT
jgi:hypothetical protein